jgi:5-methylcytosine-specific restriction protein A
MAMLKLCKCGKQINLADGLCDECKERKEKRDHRRYDNKRGSSTERGYDATWRRYRASYLKQHPLCVECLKEGFYIPATVVDHIIPHKGDRYLFWNKDNHQALCKHHHDVKTAKEDGGFGNIPNRGRGE